MNTKGEILAQVEKQDVSRYGNGDGHEHEHGSGHASGITRPRFARGTEEVCLMSFFFIRFSLLNGKR